jgi:hydroxypyruvate reductase
LAFAIAIKGEAGIWALSGDSDGIDGSEDAAGAIVTPTTLARSRSVSLDARHSLTVHDSTSYFTAIGDLVRTGPTLTNVNDIRAILVA